MAVTLSLASRELLFSFCYFLSVIQCYCGFSWYLSCFSVGIFEVVKVIGKAFFFFFA